MLPRPHPAEPIGSFPVADHDTLTVTDQLFDGLYEHTRRQLMTGRPPA